MIEDRVDDLLVDLGERPAGAVQVFERLGRGVQLLEPPDRRDLGEQVEHLVGALDPGDRLARGVEPGADPRTDDRERARASFGIRHHRLVHLDPEDEGLLAGSSFDPSRIFFAVPLRIRSCWSSLSPKSSMTFFGFLSNLPRRPRPRTPSRGNLRPWPCEPPLLGPLEPTPRRERGQGRRGHAARCVAGHGLHFGRDGLSDLRTSQSAGRALLCGLRQRAGRRRPRTRGTQGRHDLVLRPRRVHLAVRSGRSRGRPGHPGDYHARVRRRSSGSAGRSRSSSATR